MSKRLIVSFILLIFDMRSGLASNSFFLDQEDMLSSICEVLSDGVLDSARSGISKGFDAKKIARVETAMGLACSHDREWLDRQLNEQDYAGLIRGMTAMIEASNDSPAYVFRLHKTIRATLNSKSFK